MVAMVNEKNILGGSNNRFLSGVVFTGDA